jgi:hypothetical protein
MGREKLILFAKYKKMILFFILKFSFEIDPKTLLLHVKFIFKEDFHFLNLISLNFNHFLLTFAGWDPRREIK